MKTCRYVHYQLDDDPEQPADNGDALTPTKPPKNSVPKYLEVGSHRHFFWGIHTVQEGHCPSGQSNNREQRGKQAEFVECVRCETCVIASF